jgi:hypothetical protein
MLRQHVGNLLRKQGYVISRPTHIERDHQLSLWKDFISEAPAAFAKGYETNRKTLSEFPTWIDEAAMKGSLWRYGVPIEWESNCTDAADRTGVNDIEYEITQSDLIAFLARDLQPLSYLEIGVSVGKNFVQMCRQFPDANIVGLDVEEIYPILRSRFDTCEITKEETTYQVETLSGRSAKKSPSLATLTSADRTAPAFYLSADQFRDDTWAALKPNKFNLIFSDGVHSASALTTEMQFLLRHDLIDRNRFAMVWDDLFEITMQSAFLANALTLAAIFPRHKFGVLKLHGTYGMQRPIGVFTGSR